MIAMILITISNFHLISLLVSSVLWWKHWLRGVTLCFIRYVQWITNDVLLVTPTYSSRRISFLYCFILFKYDVTVLSLLKDSMFLTGWSPCLSTGGNSSPRAHSRACLHPEFTGLSPPWAHTRPLTAPLASTSWSPPRDNIERGLIDTFSIRRVWHLRQITFIAWLISVNWTHFLITLEITYPPKCIYSDKSFYSWSVSHGPLQKVRM